MNRELQSYGTQQVITSDPVTLVTMLYDKAVLALKTAVQAIHRNEIETCRKNKNKAVEIINHLFVTLDLEKGCEIASNLEALYVYMLQRLLDVDVKNDARAAVEVIELLEPLRASWRERARNSGDFKMDQSQIDAAESLIKDVDDRRFEPAARQSSTGNGVDRPAAPASATVRISE